MQARRLEVSPLGVAAAYAPWLRALLVDAQDQALAGALAARGVRAVVTDVLMPDAAREVALARRVLETV
jgi:hypothetical protein